MAKVTNNEGGKLMLVNRKSHVKRWSRVAVALCLSGLACGLQSAWAGSLSVSPLLLSGNPSRGGLAGGSLAGGSLAGGKPTVLSAGGPGSFFDGATLRVDGLVPVSASHSFGKNIPLKVALPMILPEGWRVYAQPGVHGDVSVQWRANGRPWTDAMRSVLRQAGLVGTLHVAQRALMLEVRPVPKVAPLKTVGYIQWNDALRTASSPSKAGRWGKHFHVGAATESAPLTGLTTVFLLNRGDLILTDLQKWAKQSGWTVVWQVPEDWQVPNTTSFNGDFQKAVGQVIQALSANGANVHAVFHTANNTVVIGGAGGGE